MYTFTDIQRLFSKFLMTVGVLLVPRAEGIEGCTVTFIAVFAYKATFVFFVVVVAEKCANSIPENKSDTIMCGGKV
jgi:hypothetical protein